MTITHHTSRTSELGLDISIFVPAADNGWTRSRFTILRCDEGDAFADPAPLLERAIEALRMELAELGRCPAHTKAVAEKSA